MKCHVVAVDEVEAHTYWFLETPLFPIPNLDDYAQCIRFDNKHNNQQIKILETCQVDRIVLKS